MNHSDIAGWQKKALADCAQTELAKKADINANYYAVVERGEGNLSYEKLQRILKVLKIKSLDIS